MQQDLLELVDLRGQIGVGLQGLARGHAPVERGLGEDLQGLDAQRVDGVGALHRALVAEELHHLLHLLEVGHGVEVDAVRVEPGGQLEEGADALVEVGRRDVAVAIRRELRELVPQGQPVLEDEGDLRVPREDELHDARELGVAGDEVAQLVPDDEAHLGVVEALQQPRVDHHDVGLILLDPGVGRAIELGGGAHEELHRLLEAQGLLDLPAELGQARGHALGDAEGVALEHHAQVLLARLHLALAQHALDHVAAEELVQLIADGLLEVEAQELVVHGGPPGAGVEEANPDQGSSSGSG
ncbi:MAG: hypothetical protein ABIO70_02545 [Pseudomonadota bacterium]